MSFISVSLCIWIIGGYLCSLRWYFINLCRYSVQLFAGIVLRSNNSCSLFKKILIFRKGIIYFTSLFLQLTNWILMVQWTFNNWQNNLSFCIFIGILWIFCSISMKSWQRHGIRIISFFRCAYASILGIVCITESHLLRRQIMRVLCLLISILAAEPCIMCLKGKCCTFNALVVHFVHLFIWTGWSISFLYVQFLVFIIFSSCIPFLFNNTWRIHTDLLNPFNLLLSLILPAINIIAGLSIL